MNNGILKTIYQIREEIESLCDFDLRELPTSTVYLNKEAKYKMIDIWENRESALRVLIDLKYNGYILIPF